MRRKLYFLMAAIVALFCVSFSVQAGISTTSGRAYFINIASGDAWESSSAKFGVCYWGSTDDRIGDLATTTSDKGCLASGIYWVKAGQTGNTGVTLYRYNPSQTALPTDDSSLHWNKAWTSDMTNCYVRKQWDSSDSWNENLEFQWQQTPSFSVIGVDDHGNSQGTKSFTQTSLENCAWTGTYTVTSSDLTNGKFYFWPQIGSKSFGTYSSSNQDASSGAWLGFDYSYAFYVDATAGQTVTVTIDMLNSKVTATASGSGGSSSDYPDCIWLRGSWSSNWAAEDNYMFSYQGDGVYVINNITIASGDQFKLAYSNAESDWDNYTVYINGSAGGTVYVGNTYTIVDDTNKENNTTSGGLTNVSITVDLKTMTMTISNSSMVVDDTNMPLKKADFYDENGNAKAHYFYVGTRTAGWRLLPEWELTEQSDGTYRLAGRLMYPGLFGIAKVDNYDDYKNHRYTLYTAPGKWIANNTVDGSPANAHKLSTITNKGTQSCQTDNGSAKWSKDDVAYWAWNVYVEAQTTYINKFDDWAHQTACASYLNYLDITVDGSGNVTSIDTSTEADPTKVAPHLSFTFVGSDIVFDNDDTYAVKGKGWWNHVSGQGWGDAWFQWDANGAPYIDGSKQPLYTTAYDQEWLTKHPVYFYDADKNFYYSSENLTFVEYSQLEDVNNDAYLNVYKAHPAAITGSSDQIGGVTITTDGFNYTEDFTLYGGSDSNYSSSDWQCFVVKDVWLDGAFKIWTGWSGTPKKYENAGNTNAEARWGVENGGHNIEKIEKPVWGEDPTMSGITVPVFGTKRDVNAADFKVNKNSSTEATERLYFKRVLLWYNPTEGFNKSVVQFITENLGPQIQCQRKTGDPSKLQYKWMIEQTNADKATIKSASVQRYKWNGSAWVADGDAIAQTSAVGKAATAYDAFTANIDDASEVESGVYKYIITLVYEYSTGDDDAQPIEVTKTAESNRVIIVKVGAPITLTADQLEDSEGKLRLGISLGIKTVASKLETTFTSGTSTKTVADCAAQYIITADNEAATAAAKANDWSCATSTIDTHAYASSSAKTTLKITTGTYYKAIDFVSDAAAAAASKTSNQSGITIELPHVPANVGVTETGRSAEGYGFSAYLVCNNGDATGWDQMMFQGTSASTNVTLPTPLITPADLQIAANNTITVTTDVDATLMPIGSMNVAGTGAEAPIRYSKANEMKAVVELANEYLSDKVFNDGFNVKYIVTLRNSNADAALGTFNAARELASSERTDGTLTVATAGTVAMIPAESGDAKTINDANGTATASKYYEMPNGYTFDVQMVCTDLIGGYDSSLLTNTSGVQSGAELTAPTAASGLQFVAKPSDAKYTENLIKPYDADPYYLRHGVVPYTIPTASVINGVNNSDLNLYIGHKVEDAFPSYVDEGRGSNGGCVVWEGMYPADQYSGLYLSGYSQYNGTWAEANNWANMLTKGTTVPLQIVPLCEPSTELNTSTGISAGAGVWMFYVPILKSSEGISFTYTAATDINHMKVAANAPKADATYTVVPVGINATSDGFSDQSSSGSTGIANVGYDAQNADAVYYNLQGVRVDRPVKGQLYIRVQGAETAKILY